jgi:Ca2+-binding RTX toxin-like protein
VKAGIAVVVAGLALVVAAQSDAALVTDVGGSVGYVALPGEVNNVVVARDGDALVLDDEGSLLTVALPGCVAIALHRVSCPGAQSVHLDLGDQNDTAVVNGHVPAWIDGGSGDDVLRGGDAGDVLDALSR